MPQTQMAGKCSETFICA